MAKDYRLNRLAVFFGHLMGCLQFIGYIRFILAGGGLLQLSQMFVKGYQFRINPVFHYRHFFLNNFLFVFPPYPNNDRALVNSGTDILINESGFIELGIELVVQDHLVLYCSFLVFPGYRADIEYIVRAQEGFTQRRVSPLGLLANQLRDNFGIAFRGIDLCPIPYKQIIQPDTDLGFLCIKGRRGVLIISL